MPGPESKTSKRRLRAAERRARAVDMRKLGFSYQRIADELGVSRSAAYKMVVKSLRELNDLTAERAEEVRRLELERLDDWLVRAAKEMTKEGRTLPAIDRALKIAARRAELLGLDASRKIALDVNPHETLCELLGLSAEELEEATRAVAESRR